MSHRPAQHVLEAIAASPWAITPEGLDQVVAVAQRALALDVEALEAKLGRPLDNTHAVTMRDGIATIPVTGPLFRYANLFTRLSGATAFATLARDVQTAADDPDVRGILLEVNSPGGQVDGTLELAKLILEVRDVKPIEAHVGGQANSAAYWLATAAQRIHLIETSFVGAVGAVIEIVDFRAVDEQAGIRTYTFVSSVSPKKRLEPGTSEGAAEIQRVVDTLGRVMVESVAANRAVTAQAVLERFGQGSIIVGAAAVEAGMADSLATYEDVHAALVERTGRATGLTFPGVSNLEARTMAEPTNTKVEPPAPPARLTRAQLEQEYGAEVGAIATDRATAAVTTERQRLTALDELAAAKPSQAALIAAAKADPQQTAETAALAIAKAEQRAREGHAAALAGDEQKLEKPAPLAGTPDAGSDAAVAQRVLATHQAFGGRAAPGTTPTRRSA